MMIVYEGGSALDGAPIVGILTGGSKNEKTGDMLQLWIMRSDVEPHVAVKTGEDHAVCGKCPHRGSTCYVLTFQAPLSVYRAYHRGVYKRATREEIATAVQGEAVRLGAYGDPAALPESVLEACTEGAATWTGYTHQWRTFPHLKKWCMASVDSRYEYFRATREGWRTFRVRGEDEGVERGEIKCPASDEGGNLTQCDRCGLCKGRGIDARNITILVHGRGKKNFRVAK